MKLTNTEFKAAIRSDGNLKAIVKASPWDALLYVTRQIDYEDRLTPEQRESLYDWDNDKSGV